MKRPEILADLSLHALEGCIERGEFLHGRISSEEVATLRVLLRTARIFGRLRCKIELERDLAYKASDVSAYNVLSDLVLDIAAANP